MDLFARHYNVTMPDLPGFGGMESLYKKGQPASFDNLADWLAEFVKKTYGDGKVTIVGMSLGFPIATRMLQRHPELTKNVSKLVSLFGFAAASDFKMSAGARLWNAWLTRVFSWPVTSDIYRLTLLNPFVLRNAYHRTKNAREKFKGLTPQQATENMDFEIKLWHQNDVRTHMYTAYEFLTFDNTLGPKIDLPVYHIAVKNDRFFNNQSVQKHFKQIFNDYKLLVELTNGSHAPTVVRTAKEAESLIPKELLKTLS